MMLEPHRICSAAKLRVTVVVRIKMTYRQWPYWGVWPCWSECGLFGGSVIHSLLAAC